MQWQCNLSEESTEIQQKYSSISVSPSPMQYICAVSWQSAIQYVRGQTKTWHKASPLLKLLFHTLYEGAGNHFLLHKTALNFSIWCLLPWQQRTANHEVHLRARQSLVQQYIFDGVKLGWLQTNTTLAWTVEYDGVNDPVTPHVPPIRSIGRVIDLFIGHIFLHNFIRTCDSVAPVFLNWCHATAVCTCLCVTATAAGAGPSEDSGSEPFHRLMRVEASELWASAYTRSMW